MARQTGNLFLEEWLRSNCGSDSYTTSIPSSSFPSLSSSARSIIQAWADLRDSLQHQSFNHHHLQALKTLLNSQTSLHVADPQAKLLLSIVSSQSLILPQESYPLLFRLLYIWVRKSFRPLSTLIVSVIDVLSHFFATEFSSKKSSELFSEGILLLGAFSCVPIVPEKTKIVCLELLCKLLEEEYQLVTSSLGHMPEVLAGIGYALSSSVTVYYGRIMDSLLGMWEKKDGPRGSVSQGLMILHMVEWVLSGFIQSRSLDKIKAFDQEALKTWKGSYAPFALVMVGGGVLRASSRPAPNSQGLEMISQLRTHAENHIESLALELFSTTGGLSSSDYDFSTSLLLQCIALALARCGFISSSAPLFMCLALALLSEIFPLPRLYTKALEFPESRSAGMRCSEVNEHLASVPFKEAGAITGVFCNQYISVDEDSREKVENMLWAYCQDLYLGHRQVALFLRGREDELLGNIEKIAESAFLMVVFFALAVTKHKLNSVVSQETKMETSVSILVAFSCVEYFRRMRLPEYMDTIRVVAVTVQENDSARLSFIQSMPSYVDLTNPPDFPYKAEYLWSKDEVQTARILFYLRVIPTCIERLPAPLFSNVVAPTMFLYMEHPSGKVSQASHRMFAAFISSGKDNNEDERTSIKEKLVFHYMQLSLAGYPGITPFEGMASGVVALVRHLPAGSPATFYCVHSLVENANRLCRDSAEKTDMWKNGQGENDPCKKILEFLIRLIFLVDIQVLPNLMKLLAQLIIQLPKDGQNMALNELYSQVAECDDVTRKPTLVSWLQSLSYLCSQVSGSPGSKRSEEDSASQPRDPSNWDGLTARL
ncbi:hypothetical protein HS088_TW21G01551 [Tripterygium wilfordii]|uniref:Uncharacterized protein n=1 Tax=Tripterygium wilfordii TaxID=458696 RepID=A0A7J7C6K3_TRIWF|nr:uncharacterized protein LOC119989310 [Tripterygium wilfordii]KAF5729386.1 hypothetical protein HS088_TW21G01551 [Tripterygium wilfordii]